MKEAEIQRGRWMEKERKKEIGGGQRGRTDSERELLPLSLKSLVSPLSLKYIGREGRRKGRRDGGMEGWRDGGMEGGREGGKAGGRKEGREEGTEGGRESPIDIHPVVITPFSPKSGRGAWWGKGQ